MGLHFLGGRLIDTALRWSLDGLLLSLLIFIGIALLGYYRMDNLEQNETGKPPKPESNDAKPVEGNGTKDGNKTVNITINM